MTVNRSGKSAIHFRVASRLKRLVESTRYKKSPYTARTALRTSSIRKPVITNIRKSVARECARLCKHAKGSSNSTLKGSSSEKLKTLDTKNVAKRLKKSAPIIYSVLKSTCTRPRTKSRSKRNMLTMAAALLLKSRNKQMCSMQSVISVLLYAGHASKKVFRLLY